MHNATIDRDISLRAKHSLRGQLLVVFIFFELLGRNMQSFRLRALLEHLSKLRWRLLGGNMLGFVGPTGQWQGLAYETIAFYLTLLRLHALYLARLDL